MFWGVQIFRNIRTYGRSTISEGSIYFKLAVKYMFRGVQIFRNIRTRGNHLGGVQICYDSSPDQFGFSWGDHFWEPKSDHDLD